MIFDKQLRDDKHPRGFKGMMSILAGLAMLLASTAAVAGPAAISPISIIGIDEWNVPVFPHPVNMFMQTAVVWNVDEVYDANGDKHELPHGIDVFEGITRLAHGWSYSDHLGAFWEVLVPTVWERTARGTNSGIGDPFVSYALYYKPDHNFMIGTQVFLQVPVGSTFGSEATNSSGVGQTWVGVPALLLDYTMDNGLGFEATIGGGFPFAAPYGTDPGNFYFAQAAVRYEVTPNLQLGITDVYQYRASGDYEADGKIIGEPNSYQNEIGPGFKYVFRRGTFLSGQYYFSTGGKYALAANEISLRFVELF